MFKKWLIYIVFPCLLEFLVVIEICIILKRLSQLWLWCHWSWWVDEKCNKYMRGLRPIHDITVWVSQCAGQSMFLEGWTCAKTMNGWCAVDTFTKVISLCDFDLNQIKICLTYFSLWFWFESNQNQIKNGTFSRFSLDDTNLGRNLYFRARWSPHYCLFIPEWPR